MSATAGSTAPMREIVVLSGKGGTGKTSLAACFAVLAPEAVIADCDVDASDLHLVLAPRVLARHDFWSGQEAVVRADDCGGCGVCAEVCRFDAVRVAGPPRMPVFSIDPVACEGCGVCARFCPNQAIDLPQRLCGAWMLSETRSGPMVHARLGVGGENSGRLVSLVRAEARALAVSRLARHIIVDGPPGIGCPVIASLAGADLAVTVTEPTVSGAHDLERVLRLAAHFDVPAAVCVNKWDINPAMAEQIEGHARASGAHIVGRIRYDPGVTEAQQAMRAVVETDTPSAADIVAVWERVRAIPTRPLPARGVPLPVVSGHGADPRDGHRKAGPPRTNAAAG